MARGRGGFSTATDPGELAALLTVDVDLSPLDRGLDEGRRRTATALGSMEQSAAGFSRNSRFAFQNAAFQVQDFAVQVAGGQGAVRALAQNLPQLLGGFGLWGAAIGAVVALLGGFAQAMIESSGNTEDLDDTLKDVSDRLDELADRYRAAAGAAADFAGAQLEAAGQGDLRTLLEGQAEALEGYRRALDALRQIGTPGTIGAQAIPIDDEAQGALRQLIEGFESGKKSAVDFRRELEVIASGQLPDTADALRELGEEAIAAGVNTQRFREAVEELRSGIEIGGLEELRQEVVDLKNELHIAELPEELRAAAEAAAEIGVDLTGGGLDKLSDSTRLLLEELGKLKNTVDAKKDADSEAESAAKRHARAVEDLTAKTAALRAQREALARGGVAGGAGKEEAQQVKDLADAAARFGLTVDTLKDAPPLIREIIQAFVEESAALRSVEAGHKAIEEALKRRNAAAKEAFEEQRARQKAELDLIIEAQRERSREIERRDSRIEAGGELPDQIDAANLAARGLAETLTDLDNLTFAGLLQSLAEIGAQLAQQIIQALIFRAIMGAIGGGAAGVPVASIAGASLGAGFGGATVAPIPGRAGGGPVSRGMPYWVGEYGRELMAPDTSGRVISNAELEGMGGGGRGTVIEYLDARGAVPGMEANIRNALSRDIQQLAPRATENAEKRGLVRQRRRRWG